MIQTLDLPKWQRARVWRSEAPLDAELPSAQVLRSKYQGHPGPWTANTLVVELFAPAGGVLRYGLLGAALERNAGTDFLVAVHLTKGAGGRYPEALVPPTQEPTAGLPEEYALPVSRAVEALVQTVEAPAAARLAFRWAAHTPVGSSAKIFSCLATVVATALLRDLEPREVGPLLTASLRGA